jgi:hypothetical protein
MLDFIYEDAQRALELRYKLSNKSACIDLSKKPPSEAKVSELIARLHDHLYREWPSVPKSRSKENWKWRLTDDSGDPDDKRKNKKGGSGEVGIERRAFKIGGNKEWTFQMPVISGVFSAGNRRRSIDLVRALGRSHRNFQFIELKLDSDNPLYAAFEVVGYGLSYLAARNKGHVPEKSRVGKACGIELMVLAPSEYYRFAPRKGAPQSQYLLYQLNTLEGGINRGLKSVCPKGLKMGFSFRKIAADNSIGDAPSEMDYALAITDNPYPRVYGA